MNKEGVAAAFDLLMEAIEKAHQEITEQITEASQNKDYEKVQTLVENGKSLYAFRSRVVNLRKEWQAGIDKTWPRKTKRTGKSSIAPATKLRVSFPNGTTIQERHAADTFAQTIRTLGSTKSAIWNCRNPGAFPWSTPPRGTKSMDSDKWTDGMWKPIQAPKTRRRRSTKSPRPSAFP